MSRKARRNIDHAAQRHTTTDRRLFIPSFLSRRRERRIPTSPVFGLVPRNDNVPLCHCEEGAARRGDGALACHCEPVRTLAWQSVLFLQSPGETDRRVAPLLAMTAYRALARNDRQGHIPNSEFRNSAFRIVYRSQGGQPVSSMLRMMGSSGICSMVLPPCCFV